MTQLQAQLSESREETARARAEKEALARSATHMSSSIEADLETERTLVWFFVRFAIIMMLKFPLVSACFLASRGGRARTGAA